MSPAPRRPRHRRIPRSLLLAAALAGILAPPTGLGEIRLHGELRGQPSSSQCPEFDGENVLKPVPVTRLPPPRADDPIFEELTKGDSAFPGMRFRPGRSLAGALDIQRLASSFLNSNGTRRIPHVSGVNIAAIYRRDFLDPANSEAGMAGTDGSRPQIPPGTPRLRWLQLVETSDPRADEGRIPTSPYIDPFDPNANTHDRLPFYHDEPLPAGIVDRDRLGFYDGPRRDHFGKLVTWIGKAYLVSWTPATGDVEIHDGFRYGWEASCGVPKVGFLPGGTEPMLQWRSNWDLESTLHLRSAVIWRKGESYNPIDQVGSLMNLPLPKARPHEFFRLVTTQQAPAPWEQQAPTLRSGLPSLILSEGTTAVLGAPVAAAGPVSYAWLKDGVPVPGISTSTLALTNAQPVDEGFYQVRVANEWGATLSPPAFVQIDAPWVLNAELALGTEPARTARNLRVGPDGAEFTSPTSALEFDPGLFPAEGTLDIELRTLDSEGWILDTRGTGARQVGDAVLTLNGSGRLFFTIDSQGGRDPSTLPGITSRTRVDDGSLHWIRISYGSAGLAIFVDGVPEAIEPAIRTPLVHSLVVFGDYPDSSPQSFRGTLRSIRASAQQTPAARPLELPCPGGRFVSTLTDAECLHGYWSILTKARYLCDDSGEVRQFLIGARPSPLRCAPVESGWETLLTHSAPRALAVRGVEFSPEGALFAGAASGIDYGSDAFPAEGEFEITLQTQDAVGWILDTKGIGARAAGDAVLTLNGSGRLFFAIDPVGGQNPTSLPGVTSVTPVNDGRFHTVRISYGSKGLRLYLDGRLEDRNPAVAAPLVRAPITLGDYPDGSPQSFVGRIYRLATSNLQAPDGEGAPADQGPWEFRNTTGRPMNDFHAVFRHSGGSLHDPKMTQGPPDAQISAKGHAVDILFPTPVPAGGTIAFTVRSLLGKIEFDHGWWTLGDEAIGPATPTGSQLPIVAELNIRPGSTALGELAVPGLVGYLRTTLRQLYMDSTHADLVGRALHAEWAGNVALIPLASGTVLECTVHPLAELPASEPVLTGDAKVLKGFVCSLFEPNTCLNRLARPEPDAPVEFSFLTPDYGMSACVASSNPNDGCASWLGTDTVVKWSGRDCTGTRTTEPISCFVCSLP